MDAGKLTAPRTAPTTTTQQAAAPAKPAAPKPAEAPKPATRAAALDRPAKAPASTRDAGDAARAIGDKPARPTGIHGLPADVIRERLEQLPKRPVVVDGPDRPGGRPQVRPSAERTGVDGLDYIPFVPEGSPLDQALEGRIGNHVGSAVRDALDSIGSIFGGGSNGAPDTAGTEADPNRVPPEARRVVQGLGGIARGVALAGSGTAQTIAKATRIGGRIPGAAAITGAFAAYDTFQSFRETGFSQQTTRTAAGGIGGVAGALKGGAIGASIGAFGGPVGAAVGGAAGAIIGGIAGSSVGQGIVDGFAAAGDVIRNAEINNVGDVFETGGRALWEGGKAFGSTAWNGISDQVGDIAGGIADAGSWLVDRGGEVLGNIGEAVADRVSDAVDTVTDVAEDVADTVSDVADTVSDVAGDVADTVGSAIDSITPW